MDVQEIIRLQKEPFVVDLDKTKSVLFGLTDAATSESDRLEIIRLLRNVFAVNPKVREDILSTHGQKVTKAAFKIVSESLNNDGNEVAGRCALQLVHNLLAGGSRSQEALIPYMADLLACLDSTDAKLANYAASLYLLVLNESDIEGQILSTVEVSALLCAIERHESNFALLCIQTLLKEQRYVPTVEEISEKLEKEQMLQFLDIALESNPTSFGNALIRHFATMFKVHTAQILTTMRNKDLTLDPAEVLRLLSLVTSISADENKLRALQEDKSLLIDSLYLIRMMNDMGKSDEDNMFKPVRKMADLNADETVKNPVYGFKRDLIRLLGNLCWKHRENQDQVRELSGLPLLMDCSALDGTNPLITEIVVFALRNLCEGNPENQKILSRIDKEGNIEVRL